MSGGRQVQDRAEATRQMHELKTRLSADVLEGLLAVPGIRPDEVERARVLLDSPQWCRAEEVAAELVDCFVAQRLP
jgi:hypothetical protein